MAEEKANEGGVLEKFKKDFGLMVEAGFVAVDQNDETNAVRLFRAAHTLKPDDPSSEVGMGYIALNKLEVKRAEDIFEGVLEKAPDHDLAKTFLGIAYLLMEPKRKEGEKIINEVMKKTDDPTVKELGSVALKWADKDLIKKPAPFFAVEEKSEELEEEKK